MDEQEIRSAVRDGVCPWCLKGPFVFVGAHISRIHGIDKVELRLRAGMAMTEPTCAASLSATLSALGKSRDVTYLVEARREAVRQGTVSKPTQTKPMMEATRRNFAKALEAAHAATRGRANPHGPTVPAKEYPHGTMSKYRQGCRCPACLGAKAAEGRAQVARHRELGVVPDDKHGTKTGYSMYSCRCDACRMANNRAQMVYQAHRRAMGRSNRSMRP